MGSSATQRNRLPAPGSEDSVRCSTSSPFDAATSGEGTSTSTVTVALSEGTSFDGNQVRAP